MGESVTGACMQEWKGAGRKPGQCSRLSSSRDQLCSPARDSFPQASSLPHTAETVCLQPSVPCCRPCVAVLANSGEVFSSLPSALPTFDQWLNYSAGVNINKTIAVGGRRLPPQKGACLPLAGDYSTTAAGRSSPCFAFVHSGPSSPPRNCRAWRR